VKGLSPETVVVPVAEAVGDAAGSILVTALARWREPFDFAQGRPFDFAQGRPFDFAQGRPFDSAQGRPFDSAQGKLWRGL